MADVAITNGGLIPKKNLRITTFNGTLSNVDRTMVSAVADKQIVVWKIGGNTEDANKRMALIEGTTKVLDIPIGGNSSGSMDFFDAPYVLPTNTLLASEINGANVPGSYFFTYSLIDPIIRT